MKLHPYKEFIVETSLNKKEVIERLSSLKRPKKWGFWNRVPDVFAYQKSPEKRYYIIKLKGNLFTIYLDYNIRGLGFITDFYRKMSEFGSSPRIDGIFLEQENGVTVNFSFKTPASLNIFGKFHLLSIVIYAIVVSVFITFSAPIGSIKDWVAILVIIPIMLSMLAFFTYSINKYYLNNYFKKMKPFLTNLFEAK